MYGKLFASAFTGSMIGSGAHVFAVWAYVIANTDRDSMIELNPRFLASVIGCTVEEVDAAIAKLTAPDKASRNQAEEGRRLLQRGPFLYFVTTFADYRAIRDQEDRKAYMRRYMRDYRSKDPEQQDVNKNANDEVNGKPQLAMLANTDTDTDTEADKSKDQETCASTASPPEAPDEGKPSKPKKKKAPGTDLCFEAFWAEYPVHRGKKTARELWKRKRLDDRVDDLIEDVAKRRRGDDQWKRGFVPHPSTYLRQERWDDELKARQLKTAPPTPSPVAPEPKRPPMSEETRLANMKRVDELINATLTGRKPVL